MNRIVTRFLATGALAAASLALAGDAHAGWGSHGSWGSGGGSWGSSGGSWGSSGGSWGSSGGSWGSHGSHGSHGGWTSRGSWGSRGGGLFRRAHVRWHAHRYARTWGSSGGSWGSSGGSWGSSGGSWGSNGGWYGGPVDAYSPQMDMMEEGTMEEGPMEEAAPETPEDPTTLYRRGDGMLLVRVPADARVFVNGAATRSQGAERRYISRGLQPGYDYTYEVRAERQIDGQTVADTRTVQLQAGRVAEVDFEFQVTEEASVVTTLKLDVPEDAQVFLAGAPTNSTGAERTYRTEQLSSGEAWNDYTVRVTWDQDGEPVTDERTLTLVGGESHELSFDYDEDRVASR